MKNTLPFIVPVEHTKRQQVHREIYEQSVELYDEKKYIEAFHRLLDYLGEDLRTRCGNEQGTEFHIPHGSIVVNIYIADEELRIEADFLQLPEKGRVAMLRQVADLNINRLLLAGFVKQGDSLKMRYVCPLAQSHPHKIYGVLQNICYVGDRYDDEFCTKFGATRCYEPQITPYPAETVAGVHDGLQALGRATLDALAEYNSMRAYGYSWNVLDTTLYQIAYFANPQGQFCNDLEKAINDMDADLPVEELVSKGTDYLKKLLATPREKLAEDLYFVDKLVSNRRSASLQNLQEVFKSVYEEATAAMQQDDYERAAVRMLYIFYEAYYYNDMPSDVSTIISQALKAAGNLPVEQACEPLYEALDNIMEGDLTAAATATLQETAPEAAKMMQQASTAAAEMQKKMMEQMSGADMAELQQKMTEAMARGDMAEYMRLARELQQKMMSNLFN